MKPNILAIIPARGGSRGIPRKNLRLLYGKPLLVYSVEAASGSRYIDKVVVSTEDREFVKVAINSGAEVIRRPPKLAQDDTPSLPVYKHVINHLEKTKRFYPNIVVILQPTSPLRTVKDIDQAIEKFLTAKCDSVVSVCETEHPPHWMYTLEGERLKSIIEGGDRVTRRQDAPEVYRLNGAVYVTHRDVIMKQNRVMGDDTRAYIMPVERSIDIDTEIDLKLAELLMKESEQ